MTYPVCLENNPNIHLTPENSYFSFQGKEHKFFSATQNKGESSLLINRTGAEILSLTDGTNSLEEIIEHFSSKYGETKDSVQEKIFKFYGQLQSSYAVNIQFVDSPLPRQINSTGTFEYFIPPSVPIEITYHCNLRCLHCYNAQESPEKPPQMGLKECKNLLTELKQIGVKTIELTGGEPTVHPDFEEILDFAYSLNFDLIGILTNGLNLTPRLIEKISARSDKTVLQMDLHGSKSEYLKWFTGNGDLLEIIKNRIRLLAENNVLLRVVASITPGNVDQMEEIAEIAHNNGAFGASFGPIAPMGRAENYPELIISKDREAYQQFEENFQALQDKYGEFISQVEEELLENEVNCGAGSKGLTLTPQGNVKLCQMGDDSLLHLGNALKKSFTRILREKKEVINELSTLPGPGKDGTCQDCDEIWFCHNCVVRGLLNAQRKGDKCHWLKNSLKTRPNLKALLPWKT